MEKINSKKYWNDQFNSKIVSMMKARQTMFFANIAIKLLPEWLVKDILENKLSICDLGCGTGSCTKLLSEKFKESKVIGLDFAQSAIQIAQNQYPEVDFSCKSLEEVNSSYDIIFSSNTLEHFENPFNELKKCFLILKSILFYYCLLKSSKDIKNTYIPFCIPVSP